MCDLPTDYYAHTVENRPVSEWELLTDHLQNVKLRAASSASAFGAQEWAGLAGRSIERGLRIDNKKTAGRGLPVLRWSPRGRCLRMLFSLILLRKTTGRGRLHCLQS